jgi:hypothetical protein
VAVARREGYDWGRIGRILGMTRQGARKKFPLAPPAVPPHIARTARADRERRQAELAVERFRRRQQGGTPPPVEDDDPVAW